MMLNQLNAVLNRVMNNNRLLRAQIIVVRYVNVESRALKI